MEKTYKRVPFTIELAKKVQSGEIEGRIVTNQNNVARILCYDFDCKGYPIGAAINVGTGERFCCVTNTGLRSTGEQPDDGWFTKLFIELPEEEPITFYTDIPKGHSEIHGNTISFVTEETPKHEFKPFDKVLVRDTSEGKWVPDIFRYYDDNYPKDYPYRCCANDYKYCIPYEGNERLVGTTNNPE